MSATPLFTPAAMGRPFIFVPGNHAELVLRSLAEIPKLVSVTPASRLQVRAAPETVSSGILELDNLIGGLPRGCLTEACGLASSGRTSLLLAALAAATRRQEVCALVDGTDAFDPQSATAAGVELERLLWVRCGVDDGEAHERRGRRDDREHNREGHDLSCAAFNKTWALAPAGKRNESWGEVERTLRVTDLLLQSGGFGLVAIDLGDIPFKTARRIPLTSWFRFRRAVENTPTVLLLIGQEPCARTCASLLLRLQVSGVRRQAPEKKLSAISSQLSVDLKGHDYGRAVGIAPRNPALAPKVPAHTQLLEGLRVRAEILRSRMERKPVQSVTAAFTTKTAWAG